MEKLSLDKFEKLQITSTLDKIVGGACPCDTVSVGGAHKGQTDKDDGAGTITWKDGSTSKY